MGRPLLIFKEGALMKWMGQEKARRSMDEERIDAEYGYAREVKSRYEAAKEKAVPDKGPSRPAV